MKQIRIMFTLVAVAAITTFFAGITGCEKNSGDTETGVDAYFASHPYIADPRADPDIPGKTGIFSVDPANGAAQSVGQIITFAAKNGVGPFTWASANSSLGTITTTDNSRYGVYTVLQVAINSVIVSDNEGRAAIATITAAGAGALTIIPGTYTYTSWHTNEVPSIPPSDLTGKTLNFIVTGGVPPYGSWHVSNPSLGSIDSSGVYIVNGATGSGGNIITISDSAGKIAQATVTTQMHP